MNINKVLLLSILLFSLPHDGKSQYTNYGYAVWPSTNYVAKGERLYLSGTGFSPGSAFFVFISVYRSPAFICTADTNGNIYCDITAPNEFDAYQRYWIANGDTIFFVKYEDGNPYKWQSVIESIKTESGTNSTNITVRITATVNPRHTYQVQYATNILGPWSYIGNQIPGYILRVSNVDWSVTVPKNSQSFFRIGNPQGY